MALGERLENAPTRVGTSERMIPNFRSVAVVRRAVPFVGGETGAGSVRPVRGAAGAAIEWVDRTEAGRGPRAAGRWGGVGQLMDA
jgi:hypothetical protein